MKEIEKINQNENINKFQKFNQKDKNLENFLPKSLLTDLDGKEFINEDKSYENIELNFSKFDIFDPIDEIDSYIELGNSNLDQVKFKKFLYFYLIIKHIKFFSREISI
jgi:hypothetical protein